MFPVIIVMPGLHLNLTVPALTGHSDTDLEEVPNTIPGPLSVYNDVLYSWQPWDEYSNHQDVHYVQYLDRQGFDEYSKQQDVQYKQYLDRQGFDDYDYNFGLFDYYPPGEGAQPGLF